MKHLILTVFFALFFSNISASESDLYRWLEGELESHQYVLSEVEQDSSTSDWVLKTMRVRIRASLSVEVPFLAKGKIRPEIELYYNR